MNSNLFTYFLSLLKRFFRKGDSRPLFFVRKFEHRDLQQVFEVETQTFHGENYPRFFFTQISELFPSTFLVVESNKGRIIAYAIGATTQDHPEIGWVVSMGVLTAWRRMKVGTAIMESLISALEGQGVTTILLSTSDGNLAALSLYMKLGFSVKRREPNYFGDNKTLPILQRSSTSLNRLESGYDLELLMDETEISVSFVNVLFGVSAAIVAILATRADAELFVFPFYYFFLTIFGSLYSSIFYANASGHISRLKRGRITLPIQLGNIISEYLGVYPLVIGFPLIVWDITKNIPIVTLATIADLGGFSFYQLSGFDILSRTVTRKWIHWLITIVIIGLTVAQLIAEINRRMSISIISTILLTSLLIILVVISIRTTEH